MDVPFIFIVFALLLPVTIIALFVCAVRLRPSALIFTIRTKVSR